MVQKNITISIEKYLKNNFKLLLIYLLTDYLSFYF